MIRLKVETISETLRSRAYMFTCSYLTAWNNYLTEDEKEGYSFDDVKSYMKMHRSFLDCSYKWKERV
ncbi:hypothetical protein ACFVR2_17595 [Gottfriedia sp. NPDC057991]|uniref:hypothetical protein n=1 Tax=Gottfriedia sp. NPDC057991 TaxID=3346298 RepID=UPI0036DF9E82